MVKREPQWAAERIQEGEWAIKKLDDCLRTLAKKLSYSDFKTSLCNSCSMDGEIECQSIECHNRIIQYAKDHPTKQGE